MSIFVIDASATLAPCFADEAANRSFELLNRLKQDDQASLPSNWAVEIINGSPMAVRRKRIGADELAALWERVADLPITVEFGLNRAEALAVLKLSEKHKLRPMMRRISHWRSESNYQWRRSTLICNVRLQPKIS
jgi:hypothetical protein